MGFWPYLRHAHGSDDDDDEPPSATGISRTTFFSWLFLLPYHTQTREEKKRKANKPSQHLINSSLQPNHALEIKSK